MGVLLGGGKHIKKLTSGGTRPAFAGVLSKYKEEGGGLEVAKKTAKVAKKVRVGINDRASSLLDINT